MMSKKPKKVKRPPKFIPGPRSANRLTLRTNHGFIRFNPVILGGRRTRHMLQNLGIQVQPNLRIIPPDDLPTTFSPPSVDNFTVDNLVDNQIVDSSHAQVPTEPEVSYLEENIQFAHQQNFSSWQERFNSFVGLYTFKIREF